MADEYLTILIGPARPRIECGCTRSSRCLCGEDGFRISMSLARLSARFAKTVVLDPQGGAVILGDTQVEMDIELF